ncbi:MAG TPA: response regulator [Burkholderiaceae bacterium]|nr:response regulator [Burkholderiaceae bacterium]
MAVSLRPEAGPQAPGAVGVSAGRKDASEPESGYGALDEGLPRGNILIVDDLPEKLLVMRSVLEDLGQNLVFVRSGSEALREVLQREFAVILLDVNMPDIDGFETAALIRTYKRSAHTPIIFVTAYADEMQTARGYSLGAVDYILAPVMPEVLRSKVKVFVDLWAMQQRVRRWADERIALAAAEAARAAAEENTRRSNFLSQASRVLSGSLDWSIATRELLRLVVGEMAPVALLALLDGEGRPGAALVQRAGDAEPFALDRWHDVPRDARELVERALELHARVDQPALQPDFDTGPTGFWPSDLEGPLAAAAVPLASGTQPLAALLVAGPLPQPVATARAFAPLEELAGRAAIALHNALLYRSLQAEIVERRQAEERLQESNRRKDEFLAMLSHELRNPLAPIRNALEVVRRVAPPDQRIAWAGEVMDRQVKHLTRLVEELLDVARINQGKIVLNKERLELASVVQQAIETARPLIDARRHTLEVQLPARPVWLQGDMARLTQIIANLLNNAAKYTEEGGRIELSASACDGQAEIRVRDNGIGIEPALMPRIFELFEQGERSLDRSQGGLGVGLTLVQRLVEMHQGRVEAWSAGRGAGAEFRVFLPCLNAVQEAEGEAEAPGLTAGRAGLRVLIVDDNLDAAESVAVMLSLDGHEVKTVGDGPQAVACAPVFLPEVVLLDIGLPGLDGYEVARLLRAMPELRSCLLVALTGYGQAEDRELARAAGFDAHLVKPASPQEISRLIDEHAERRQRGGADDRQGAA